MATSYANPGGTGNRTGTIIIFSVGLVSPNSGPMIDGTTASGSLWFSSGTGCSFEFWFPSRKIIDEAKFYQGGSATHGTWQWQGSDDHVTWTNIGSPYTLGGASPQTVTALAGNVTGYLYYRTIQTAGATNGGPFIHEWEFKIDEAGTTSYLNALGSGNRGSTVTVSSSGITWSTGTPHPYLVNGSKTAEMFWDASAVAGHWIRADLGDRYVVQESRLWFSDNAANQGDWKLQGSDDAAAWTDLSGTVTLGLGQQTPPHKVSTIGGFTGNTTAYRYYRLLGMAGSRTTAPTEQEWEFMVAAAATPALVTVPDVVGLTAAAADTALVAAGLVTGTVTTAPSTTVAIGLVISQSPTAGSIVAPGSDVDLVVSTGVTVPDVVGQTEASADAELIAAGLVTGTVTTAYHATVPVGLVLSQTPTAGTQVNGGSDVDLVLSSGPAPDYTWQIEDLTGATRWMTGLVVFAEGDVVALPPPPPGGPTPTPTQVVIPMHVTTRVVFAVGINEWGADCLCDE